MDERSGTVVDVENECEIVRYAFENGERANVDSTSGRGRRVKDVINVDSRNGGGGRGRGEGEGERARKGDLMSFFSCEAGEGVVD